jgi:glutamate--cysteine ligase
VSDLEATSEEPLRASDLVDCFRSRERRGKPRQVGVELELSLVRASDLRPIALRGPASLERLFARLSREGGWSERVEGEGAAKHAIGLERAGSEDRIALEPGGQVELVTAPLAGAGELARRLGSLLGELVAAAAAEGLLVLGGGLQPFARLEALPRVPKERYELMRRYFAALGPRARLAPTMMHATQSIQASFDWDDERDGALQLEATFRTGPVLAALLAASPVEAGERTRFLSRRLAIWRETDPARTGVVAAAIAPGARYDAWVSYALDVPLLLRVERGRYVAAGPGTFRDVVERGWPDGRRATRADWETHLSTIFTHARWKRVIEHRALDGPLPGEASAVVALLVGLLEHRPSRDRALARLAWATAEDLERAFVSASEVGLEASFGRTTLGDEARALVALARAGLEDRERLGLEPRGTPDLLVPLERRALSGETPAVELARAFERGELLERLVIRGPSGSSSREAA